jgi:hypothetical protein
MFELKDTVTHPAPARRDRSIVAPRREARRQKGARERRIIDLLNRGVSIAELAASEGVTLRRMQILVKTILARHAPPAPAEYLALQISRLNQAMFVASGEMSKGNLKAVELVMRLASEMDRYHGFFPNAEDKRVRPDRLAEPAPAPLALAAPAAKGAMEMAAQALEKAHFGDGNGMAPGSSDDAAPATRGAMEMAPQCVGRSGRSRR